MVQLGMGTVAAAVLAGCSTASSMPTAAGPTASKQVVIGLSNQTMAVTFPVGLAKGAQQEADKLGAKVLFQHTSSGKGKMVVSYNSLDELEGILTHIH